MRIVRYIAIFSAATIFGLAVSFIAPVAAADASCLAWISHLAGRQAPLHPSSADRHQAPCKSRAISRLSRRRRFSQRRRFLASLVAPVAAADASCLAWISDLTGRQAPRRPSSVDRHQAPCKSRGISRFSRRRRFFSTATIFGLAVSLVAPIAATGASCLAWILDLTGRRAPRRSCSAG